jgi:diketogulonate reductase-like aldo/keto reductase
VAGSRRISLNNGVDTAAAYGNEREVGEGIRRSGIDRNDIFVTTKLWISDYGHEQALIGFDGCLRRLGLDYVDRFLLHHPVPSDFDRTVVAYTAIEQMLADGRTHAIGVSNFSERHLENLISRTSVVPAVNQVELHPFFNQHPLRDFLVANGIATQACKRGPAEASQASFRSRYCRSSCAASSISLCRHSAAR